MTKLYFHYCWVLTWSVNLCFVENPLLQISHLYRLSSGAVWYWSLCRNICPGGTSLPHKSQVNFSWDLLICLDNSLTILPQCGQGVSGNSAIWTIFIWFGMLEPFKTFPQISHIVGMVCLGGCFRLCAYNLCSREIWIVSKTSSQSSQRNFQHPLWISLMWSLYSWWLLNLWGHCVHWLLWNGPRKLSENKTSLKIYFKLWPRK